MKDIDHSVKQFEIGDPVKAVQSYYPAGMGGGGEAIYSTGKIIKATQGEPPKHFMGNYRTHWVYLVEFEDEERHWVHQSKIKRAK